MRLAKSTGGPKYFKKEDMPKVFENVYQKNVWETAGGSGVGSLPEYAQNYRRILTGLLNEDGINTVVDFGCGAWVVYDGFEWPDHIEYTGIDVSDTALARARENCKKDNFKFLKITDYLEIPRGDLLIVKEVMQHWPEDSTIDFLKSVEGHYKKVLLIGIIDRTLPEGWPYKEFVKHPHEKKPSKDVGYWIL